MALSQKEANALHKKHIKTCDTILALKKVERFCKESEKILGRKVRWQEAAEILMGKKFKKGKA